MFREDLKDATEPVLALIVAQAEKRLDAQCSFADTQDTKATSLVNAAAALAAAALALGGGSLALGQSGAVTVGAFTGLAGFIAAASLCLAALQSNAFHSCGFYPVDFVGDVKAGRSVRDLHEDFALDLQIRLSENKRSLASRGKLIDSAAWVLSATPPLACIAALFST